jgi:hypothetical protein
LYAAVSGEAILYENWVGDRIYPLGNVKKQTLPEIITNLNQQRLLKLYHFYPRKYFFYPFRKYLDLQKLFPDLDLPGADQIYNPVFLRSEAAELLQIKQKQFDRTTELCAARQIYKGDNTIPMTNCLDIIERYGDLSDVFALRMLLNRINDRKIKRKIQETLATTYSVRME